MSRVRAYFVEEADECLGALEQELGGPAPDPASVYRAVRQFRGSAQVARFGALADEARELEQALKPVADGARSWEDGLAERVRQITMSLARGVDAVRDGQTEQDERGPAMDELDQQEVGAGDMVPIESLEYQGREALDSAASLREPLEEAIVAGDPPGAILDELFDLIRLGTK